MKEQIQDLIAKGKLEQALELLRTVDCDNALPLLGRYNTLERGHRLGMMDQRDYTISRNKITYALLEYADELKGTTVHVHQSTTMSITFNMPAKNFKEAVEQVAFEVLEEMCMKAFEAHPALLDAVLDITAPIVRKIKTNRPLTPGQIVDAKAELVQLYTEFITKETTDTSARQLADLTAIVESLKDEVDEEGVLAAFDNLEIFLVDNPARAGLHELRKRRRELTDSEDNAVKRRMKRLQPVVNAERTWIVQVTNRIIQSLEK